MLVHFLWPPCVARCRHYIFILWFLLLFLFPRLISAVGDWMSTILPHMVWPNCKFRMQVWNVLCVARWKYRTQNIAKKSASGHHPTTCRAISLQLRHVSTIGKLTKLQHLLHMSSQYGELRPTGGWDHFVSLGHPCKFQWVSRLGSITARSTPLY